MCFGLWCHWTMNIRMTIICWIQMCIILLLLVKENKYIEHRRKTSEKNIGVKLNHTQREILNLLLENCKLTADEMASSIGISRRNIEANIRKLKDYGILYRHGSPKKGYWEVVDKSKTKETL